MLKSDSIGAIYDLKKEEIVNKDKIKKRKTIKFYVWIKNTNKL